VLITVAEMTAQRLALDLERNEELAKLVADMEPGEKLDAKLSIVAKDDKTVTVEVEEVGECENDGEEYDEEEAEEAEESEDDMPAVKVMRGKTEK
jgi:hypothetical protein